MDRKRVRIMPINQWVIMDLCINRKAEDKTEIRGTTSLNSLELVKAVPHPSNKVPSNSNLKTHTVNSSTDQ